MSFGGHPNDAGDILFSEAGLQQRIHDCEVLEPQGNALRACLQRFQLLLGEVGPSGRWAEAWLRIVCADRVTRHSLLELKKRTARFRRSSFLAGDSISRTVGLRPLTACIARLVVRPAARRTLSRPR